MHGTWRPALSFTLVFSIPLALAMRAEAPHPGFVVVVLFLGPASGMLLALMHSEAALEVARIIAREPGGKVGEAEINFAAKAKVVVSGGRGEWRVEAWKYVRGLERREIVRPDGERFRLGGSTSAEQVVRDWHITTNADRLGRA